MSPKCGICLSEYDEQDHTPRLLICGHTVCEKCAGAFLKGDVQIKCPFDRTITSVPSGNVRQLPKNFAILEILNDPEMDPLKTKCAQEESHRATVFCETCQVDLCEKCFQEIHAPQELTEHEKIPIACKPYQLPKCQLHPDKVVEYVCKEATCQVDSKFMCETCLPCHPNHQKESLQEIVKANQKLLEEQLEKLQLESEQLKKDAKELKTVKASFKRDSPAYQAKQNEISEHFNRQKTATLDMFLAIAESNDELCSIKLDRLGTMERLLDAKMKEIEQRLASKNNLECLDDMEFGVIYASGEPDVNLRDLYLFWPTSENMLFELIPQH